MVEYEFIVLSEMEGLADVFWRTDLPYLTAIVTQLFHHLLTILVLSSSV